MVKDILVLDGSPNTWQQVLEQTYVALYRHKYVKKSFLSACVEREKEFPTGLPTEIGVAIPHADAKHVIIPSICVLRLEKSVFFRNMGNSNNLIEVQYVFNLALVDDNEQVPMLKSILHLVKDKNYLMNCKTKPLHQIRNELIALWCNGNSKQ